ncbi:hypothetical protein A0J61_09019 [Choanephora cucurbitarum]|uniref:Uncharacterized protein n=1 Tax=Choanephora cucurbitarum TaxID=101091 RepID=A0A1C7N2L8_9FUNG|nr:hypothetical protein A0J61_09019 [Choanephora cucurbitarum]
MQERKRSSPFIEIYKNIEFLLKDKDSKFEYNMKHMQAHIQIFITEHQTTVDRCMSFIKAHNIDLYVLLALMILIVFSIFACAVSRLFVSEKASTKKKEKSTLNDDI